MIKILKDIEAVIFDLDGTLIDSLWMWDDININILIECGIDVPCNLHEREGSMNCVEILHYLRDELRVPMSLEEIRNKMDDMAYENYSSKVSLKQGAMELLQYLKYKDIKIGLATNSPSKLVHAAINNLQITDYFGSIHTLDDEFEAKPCPDIYLTTAKDLGVDICKCMVFEDTVHGIMAGKNANMTVCAVYDENSKESSDLKKECADYYIEDFGMLWRGEMGMQLSSLQKNE